MEKELVHEEEGWKVWVEQDIDSSSPAEWDNFGTLVHWHRREDMFGIPMSTKQELDRVRQGFKKNLVMLRVYLYEHSGLAVSTEPFSCQWDSGQVGYIFVDKKKIREEFGVKRVTHSVKIRAEEMLKSQVESWNMYYQGDVWGFMIESPTGEEVESCWDFYGFENCKEEGNAELKCILECEKKNQTLPLEFD